MTARPVITLLTDFGTRDPYVGVMKGVMAGLCPDATFVDLTHEVPPQDLEAAAFYLRASWPWFPRGTHHLVVVDPGVGTERRMLLAEVDGQRFCGPDNGLLPAALAEADDVVWREVVARRWHVRPRSSTFHGRDLFAPTIAFLAAGGDVAAVAPRTVEPVRLPRAKPRGPSASHATEGVVEGRVAVVDHFGNLITDLPGAWREHAACAFEVAGRRIDRVVPTFAEAPAGEPVALVGSFGTFELVVDRGSAARALGVGAGELVRLHWKRRPPVP